VKYYDQIVGAEVYLKLTNNDKGETKIAEIKLNIPGNDLFASSQSDKFEGAINAATDKLKGQIRKLKTKMSTH
jgi:putative sigma-54 modulation protein